MEADKSPQKTPFLQDTQKLTFALGLTAGLAIMSIVGFILVSVRIGGSSTSTKKATNTNTAAAANTNTNAGPVYDPVALAKSVGVNESKFRSCLDSGKYKDRITRDLSEGSTAGVNGTPATFINGTLISGAYPYSDVKAAIDAALSGTKGSANIPDIRDDDHLFGKKTAPVKIVEYTDYQCPFCHRFHPTVEQAVKEYGDKVVWVLRHYPLTSIHPYAQSLAESAECINEIGGKDKFWDYTNTVMAM